MDIVIVNWNAGAQLQQCLESIAFQANKVVVVDNASTDGSEEIVKKFPGVELIQENVNLGFGKACNIGSRHGSDEFLLFLNPDAALYPDTLERSLHFMRDPAHSHIGICGVQLLDEYDHVARSCARFPSAGGMLLHAIGLDRVFSGLGHLMVDWDHAQTKEVEHVIGAFFLVRRQMFEALQGFDEKFFVYLEDLDFSYRARQAGWASMYLADVQAFHAGGGTSNQIKARRLFYSLRSRLIYAYKHFSWVSAIFVLLATILIEPLSRAAVSLLRGSLSGFKETCSAYRMLWAWLPKWAFRGDTR